MYLDILLAGLLSWTCTAAVIESRQSTVWQDSCGNTHPGDFKAFNVGNCQAQLTFTRGKNVGVMWNFDAIYPDGLRKKFDPIRNFSNIAVSDPFYTYGYGNNFVTNRTKSDAFTSVHEFPYVCSSSGAVPSAWFFYTSSANSACTSKDYRYTTRRISAKSARRPARTNFSGRRVESADNIEISWTSVSGAQSYNAFIRIPTSTYEDGSGYFTTDRGARIAAPAGRATFPGTITFRNPEEPRKVYVNVMNSWGVWSYTPDTEPINVYV